MIRDRLSWMRFLGFDLGGADAGREHDPAVPRQAHRERDAEAGDEGVRLAAPEEGLHPDGRTDRRREPGPGAEAAQHRRREGGDQGRQVGQGDLAGRAEQGGAEGHERALDAEGRRQGPLSARRHAAADDRGAGLRLQDPHLHRPAVRLHPRERRHIGLGCRRTDAEAARDDRRTPRARSGPTARTGRGRTRNGSPRKC